MKDDLRHKLAEFIQMELDGILTDAQFHELVSILKTDIKSRQYYARTMSTIAIFRNDLPLTLESSAYQPEENSFDSEFWQTLSQEERDAKPLPACPVLPIREVITDVRQRKAMLKIRRQKYPASLWLSIVSMVAMLIMVAYVMLNPRTTYPVATLTASYKAQWQTKTLDTGSRLANEGTSMKLLGGLAKLRFDNGAELVLEGPAEFKILADDRIDLRSGKLYAKVPQEAIGFSIYTKNAKVIDLGTEFGMNVYEQGDTYLHVIKGSTRLIAGEKSGKQDSVVVGKGVAKRVSGDSAAIWDIPCNTRLFVRAFNPETGYVWNGQPKLDLADIVGGGDGFGLSQKCVGINPVTGKSVDSLLFLNRKPGTNDYHPVLDISYIDGIFVPQGSSVGQVVSSQGHIFTECPQTDGRYWMEVTNRPITSPAGTSLGKNQDLDVVRLGGVQFGTPQHPAIMMHANVGITFDLNIIRTKVPGTVIRAFTALCGLSETTSKADASAVLWVLVDGQVREKIAVNTLQNQHDISVALSDSERFLTLIATDDGNGIAGDWTFFGNPALWLESSGPGKQ